MTRLTFLLLMLAAAAHGDVRSPPGEEDLLKAAFIYNFTKFTRWPQSAWSAPDADLLLCTAGHDSTAEALGGLAGKSVMGHSVRIRALSDEASAAGCHTLYIAPYKRNRYTGIIASVRGRPVLTVTQSPAAKHPGAIIRLFEQDGRIRFAVDVGAARRAGLEFSSRLLDLGIIVGVGEDL